jgi:hypothetical protein
LAAGFVGAVPLTAATGRPWLSALVVNAAGAAKEYTDYRNGGWCSGKDLVANALGSWLGSHYGMQVWRSERGTVMLGVSIPMR